MMKSLPSILKTKNSRKIHKFREPLRAQRKSYNAKTQRFENTTKKYNSYRNSWSNPKREPTLKMPKSKTKLKNSIKH